MGFENKNIFYVADFETTQGENSQVVLSGFKSSSINLHNSQPVLTLGVGDFLEKLIKHVQQKTLSKRTKHLGVKVFFHNGSGYDFAFIINYLARNPQKYHQKTFRKSKQHVKWERQSAYLISQLLMSKQKNVNQPGDYELTIQESHKIIKFKLWFSKDHFLDFRCSWKIMSKPLSELGKDLVEMGYKNSLKGNYNYKLITEYKNLNQVPPSLVIYLKQDLHILCTWLQEFFKIRDVGFYNLPISASGIAYNNWKYMITPTLINWYNQTYPLQKKIYFYKYNQKYQKSFSNGKKLSVNKSFKQPFNKLFGIEKISAALQVDLKKWYGGGLTHYNPAHFGKVLTNINAFDVNSMYSSVMDSELKFPYGVPKSGNGGEEYPLKLWKIKVFYGNFKRVLNNLPILIATSKTMVKFYGDSNHDRTLYLTGEEWNYVQKTYQKTGVFFKATVVYSFKSVSGKFLFGEYVKKWYDIKTNPEGKSGVMLTKTAKLMLNSLYGKFAQKVILDGYVFNPGVKWGEESPRIKIFDKVTEVVKNQHYIPIAIWITAYARLKLAAACENQYDKVAYLDTDSIWVLSTYQTTNIKIGSELGNWKQDYEHVILIIAGKKRYVVFQPEKTSNQKWLAGVLDNTPHLTTMASYKYNPVKIKQHQKFKLKNMITGFTFKNISQVIHSKYGKQFVEIEKVLEPVWHSGYAKNPDIPKEKLTKQHFLTLLKKVPDTWNL